MAALGALAVGGALIRTDWQVTGVTVPIASVAFLITATILGEAIPIRLLGPGVEPRMLSTSAPFVLALVAVGGVGVAILAQVVASVTDDVIHRRPLRKSIFNSSQYALSVLAAGAVYTSLSGVSLNHVPEGAPNIAALLAAGVAMVSVNWVLVAGVVSIASRQPFGVVLRDDSWHTIMTHLVLISLGGIAADIAGDGVWVLALLGAPVATAHLLTSSAIRHAHDASHDALTGLWNRMYLQRTLDHALANRSDSGPGLILLDLDHFKDINDTLGHPVGDEILREVADHLVKAAPEDATVYRLGGDEFAVVVEGDAAAAQDAARDLLASLDQPVSVEGIELLVRASVGVAVAPAHGSDTETLMKNADIALYHAKLERDRISTFSTEFDINTVERLQLLADLRVALDANQLHVVYQPQVNLDTMRTVAVEALVRWNHPTRGLVSPGEFIPLAENSGLIVRLTGFVLDAALAQVAAWRAAGFDIRMSVNLSARHLSDLAFPHQLADALVRNRVSPSSLVLEVTETGILSDAARADRVIRAIRGLGVAVAIDDYGTGNASLNYLKRLQIDELKIDRSFVGNIGSDDHDLIIVRSTIGLALDLGVRVVAEGIEDQATVELLREVGSVVGQGYLLGRPTDAEFIAARLAAEQHAAAGL